MDMRLSPRQREIVHLIALGMSDTEIAAEPPRTIGSHLIRVYVLHDVHKRAQLVAAVLSEGSLTRFCDEHRGAAAHGR
jgi:DNA-binding NarL/FixJ family response regulator